MAGSINLSLVNRRASPDRVTFGEAEYRPGGSCGPRIQSDHQLVAVVSGEAHVRSGDRAFRIPAGHVALMALGRDERFVFSPRMPTRHLWVSVAASPIATDGFVLDPIPLSSRLAELIELGLSVPVASEADGLVEQLGAACLACFRFDFVSRKQGALEDPVAKACAVMRRRMGQRIDLKSIAFEAGLSPQHLTRLFRRSFGATPMSRLWEMRLRLAGDLLRETGLTVTEIANRTGFQTPHHMARRFRDAFGVSPTEWRSQAWNHGREPIILNAEDPRWPNHS